MASVEIKLLCIKLGISVSELARRNGSTPQAFSQKMQRDSFTTKDLCSIARSVGCEYESSFVLPNGERIVEWFPKISSQEGGEVKMERNAGFLSERDLERRCRYRLSLHGMKMRKVKGNNDQAVYYLFENGTDDSPPEYDSAYLVLDQVAEYCEELEAQDRLDREEKKSSKV